PFSSVTTVCATRVAVLVTVTVTPGSTPPDLSVTVPEMPPRTSCAPSGTAAAIKIRRADRHPHITSRFIAVVLSRKKPGRGPDGRTKCMRYYHFEKWSVKWQFHLTR